MAESLAQRLQRIAREKAASAAGGASAPVAQPTQVTEEVSDEVVKDSLGGLDGSHTKPEQDGELLSILPDNIVCDTNSAIASSDSNSAGGLAQREPSTHPLAMAFAELEAGLLARDPEFKTKLRDIHRHLGREPELVTQMTEAEIALIVTGMVVFANAEIVEPAAKKAGKAAVKAASKVVISADDL